MHGFWNSNPILNATVWIMLWLIPVGGIMGMAGLVAAMAGVHVPWFVWALAVLGALSMVELRWCPMINAWHRFFCHECREERVSRHQ